MAERERSYLLVPAGGAGEGMGHLLRCLRLSAQLGRRVSFLTSHLDESARVLLTARIRELPRGPRPALLSRLAPGSHWDLVVTDARRMAAAELGELMGHGLVVGLDEGGEARDLAPFLVDTLPGPPGRAPANLSDPAYLFLPRQTRMRPPSALRKILLSLGGEDKERLAETLAHAMVHGGVAGASQITVVQGPLSRAGTWPTGVEVVDGARDLPRLFSSHDVLITHFGMAAFEALAAGIPAILFNPTAYHDELGRVAGFPRIGVGRPDVGRLRELLSSPARLYRHPREFNRGIGRERGKKLSATLGNLVLIGSSECPVCLRGGNLVIGRFPDRTYRRCQGCGTRYMESYAGRRKEYADRYFFSDYKAQYGRTYLEDFDSIRAACTPRVRNVLRLLGEAPGSDGGSVVDVGCAYGPFLAALRDEGVAAFGLDVSAGAVAHVRKSLGLPAVRASFETVDLGRLPRRISAVTLWYVIEHFPRTREVLARAAALLPPGGVLAFSTPNGSGISARTRMQSFLRASPGDHFTILSPRGLGRILADHGLRLRIIRVTGHHPERFPGVLGAAAGRWKAAAAVLRLVSEWWGLGDTFEAYAVKEAPGEVSGGVPGEAHGEAPPRAPKGAS